MKRINAILIMLFVTLLWGISFPITKNVLNEDIKPFQFLTIRLLIASIIMMIFYKPNFKKENLPAIKSGSLLGVFLYLGLGLQTLGLRYTTSTNSSFITMLYIVFVPIFSSLIFKNKIGLAPYLFAGIAMIGALFIVGFDLNNLDIGDLLTLLCAIAFAFQIIFISKSAPKYDNIVISSYQNFTGAILSLITMLIFEGFKIRFTFNTWLVLLYMGVIVSIIAYTLQIKAQSSLTAVQASIICSLEAVFASLSAIIFYDEKVKLLTLIGMLLILLSIILPEIITFKIKKSHHRNMV